MEVKQALWSIENAEREKKKNNDEIADYKLELETLKQKAKNIKKSHNRGQACGCSTAANVRRN